MVTDGHGCLRVDSMRKPKCGRMKHGATYVYNLSHFWDVKYMCEDTLLTAYFVPLPGESHGVNQVCWLRVVTGGHG